ncbi:protein translocase subunit SecD [Tropheryma whipplei]|uniref:protein translocase subunit SecD n=1 Tax=Tropheryma whipplei TaxID=2039 RepID=UPI0004BCE882|nr:protein translocase subunit SecD [Tropheryma whipplei]
MHKFPPAIRKARRSLGILAVVVLLLLSLDIWQVFFSGSTFLPKLALDLEGGTQIVLRAKAAEKEITSEQLQQAVAIIRNRVDSSGISEAEISVQGSTNISVSIPGTPSQEVYDRIRSSSKMDMRAVLLTKPIQHAAMNEGSTHAGSTASAAIGDKSATRGSPKSSEHRKNIPKTPHDTSGMIPSPRPKNGSDMAWITKYWRDRFDSHNCKDNAGDSTPDNLPLVVCDQYGTTKYLLGPVEVSGTDISRAVADPVSSHFAGASIGWGVTITFNAHGGEKFKDVSNRLISLAAPRNQFAAVLDGVVITAPEVRGVTSNPQITGNFNQTTATALASQLSFGSLPVSFEVQSSENISATLGSSQLQSGILAGILGMILVVVYSLFQYRLLGLLTVSSLICSAIVTYLVITFLSWQNGYRLSLAGVAGLIVAIGITADSFIVYFERVKDELREGRDIVRAVDRGWSRALRTICASDAVNFLAAIVLFLVAVGSVKGFAFTLGLTTLVDLLVVVFFTHPVLQYLSHSSFFTRKYSGLNVKSAVYRGRLMTRDKSQKTIAERKAGH